MKRIFIFLFILSFFPFLFSASPKKTINDIPSPTNAEEQYFIDFLVHLNKSQTKLTYMNKKSSMAKIGTETINGDISGTLFYNVKIKGAGAVVTLRYTDYCDEDGWKFDGEIITKSNMSQNGTFEGVITVTGNNPGKVYYENLILKDGAPGDGTYGIEQEGLDRKEISYKYFFNYK